MDTIDISWYYNPTYFNSLRRSFSSSVELDEDENEDENIIKEIKIPSKKYKKYPCTIGVELTFSFKKFNDSDENYFYKVNDVKRELRCLSDKLKPKYKPFSKVMLENITTDSSVEMPTPILHNSYEAELAWYISNYAVEKAGELQTKQIQTSGGHIHMYIKNKENSEAENVQMAINILKYFANRPWLSWGFNDPDDNINAFNVVYEDDLIGKIRKLKGDKKTFYNLDKLQSDRHYAAVYRSDYGTIEFRFFEMPITLERYHQHINFILAIREKCLTKLNEGIKYTKDSIKDIPIRLAVFNFNQDIKKLGFNPNDFQWAIKNIVTRYSYGLEYLN